MRETRLHFHWQKTPSSRFRTGVSLHSHTLHSHECLDFIHRTTRNVPWLSGAIRRQEKRYRALTGRDVDLTRAWWTPPLSARQAWQLEADQIEQRLAMSAVVSLSDHDNIDAGMHLHVLDAGREIPISVEWTVPFRRTFFHIGVHNIHPDYATAAMTEMRAATKSRGETSIAELLEWLARDPASLIVFNHPAWDENHIGAEAHRQYVEEFLGLYRPFLHAVELNGLRPWKENREAAQIGASAGLPLVSGGDRHAREPNACVNLTNAAGFGEFADEIRRDGWSDILFLPHYREPVPMRILENMCDILEDDPAHALGWVRWSDRVFYETDQGVTKSLAELWGAEFPSVVNQFVGLMHVAKLQHVRAALRAALMERIDFVL